MRKKNNDDHINSNFIARFILDIIIQWLVSCISLISINIKIQINSSVICQIHYSKMVRMLEDDVLYGAKG